MLDEKDLRRQDDNGKLESLTNEDPRTTAVQIIGPLSFLNLLSDLTVIIGKRENMIAANEAFEKITKLDNKELSEKILNWAFSRVKPRKSWLRIPEENDGPIHIHQTIRHHQPRKTDFKRFLTILRY